MLEVINIIRIDFYIYINIKSKLLTTLGLNNYDEIDFVTNLYLCII